MLKALFSAPCLLILAGTTLAQPLPANRLGDPALSVVPTDSFLFLSVKASKLWDNPAAKPFRDWVATQKDDPFANTLGVTGAELDRVTLFAPTSWRAGGEPVLLVTTRKPYNEVRVLKSLGIGEREGRGRERRPDSRVFPIEGAFSWLILLDEHTLVYMPRVRHEETGPTFIAQLLARKPDGPLASALALAPSHDITFGIDVGSFGEQFAVRDGGRDNPLTPFLSMFKARTATFTADFDKTAAGKLTLTFPNAAAAKRAGPVLEEGMRTLIDHFGEELERGGTRSDPFGKAMLGAAVKVLKNAKVTTVGADVVAAADLPYADDVAKLVMVLPKSLATARGNAKAINNLKQLALAMHNHESAYSFFPSDVGHGPKPPAMSWRVQILPFLEHDTAFRQLDMTRPWNDPANLKVLEAMEMPKVFEHPGRPAPKGHTYFRIFMLPRNAKGMDRPLLAEGERAPRFADITDGTSNTLMIVEAGEAVPWYKPDVLAYDGKLPLPQLGDKEADLFLAAFCDGSVRALRPSKVGEQTLRALITRAGGEVIPNVDR